MNNFLKYITGLGILLFLPIFYLLVAVVSILCFPMKVYKDMEKEVIKKR